MIKIKYPYSTLIDARKHSVNNWGDLSRSTLCGCYHCGNIFLSNSISEWIGMDSRSMDDATAICPFCGMNTVIAKSSSYPLQKDFLEHMNRYWFKDET